MATNKLEDFILNNREAFDDEQPPLSIWDQIEGALDASEEDSLEAFVSEQRDAFDDEQVPLGVWGRIEATLETSDDDNDPLEVFIANNREAFDDSTPPPRLEGRVFAALTPAAGATPMPPLRAVRGRRLKMFGMAAAVLLLIAASFTIGNKIGYDTAEEDQLATQLRQISPELAEAEDYYRGEIAAQFTKVEMVNDDPQLLNDLAAMDAATEEIRAALLEVPVSQRAALVDRLIETYRTKLDILLRIQQHIPKDATAPNSTTQQNTNES
ncbi:MAG: hypothetical protein AAF840_03465 [Bacteroidota bacterium]